jgi:hypothetical protein
MNKFLLAVMLGCAVAGPAWADPAGGTPPPADETTMPADETAEPVSSVPTPAGEVPSGISQVERKREPACRAEAESRGLSGSDAQRHVRACQRRTRD